MESLALTFSSGWASGINAYLVVLVLGVVQRTTGAESIPDVLGTWPVLIGAGLLYAVEFVADKVPYIDSTWDSISTVIRPTIGAVIGVLLAGEADSLDEAVGGVVGGTSALMSHLVKASERLAVNSSPEPVSNSVVSVVEDAVVLGVVWFATEHPLAAAAVAGVLLVAGLVLVYLLVRAVRGGWRKLTRRGRRGGPPGPEGPRSDDSTQPYPAR
ncbi:DUF4126 domain-containing protein [Nocardioides albertanoniae]|nr:DUF4126 domain-containing protein [Nocardioides albertanoniae]